MFFWPGWKQLGFAAALGFAEFLLFVVVYGGANWLTDRHAWRVPLATEFDRTIPLLPAMSVVYLSLNPMFWSMAFILRTRAEITAFVCTLAISTLVAGLFFVTLPGAHAHVQPSTTELGIWQDTFRVMQAIALEYNYAPSLHVAFTVICVLVAIRTGNRLEQAAFALWGIAILLSTLLTHQHYLVDVVTGLLLGWTAVSCGYDRWLARWRSRAREIHYPSLAIDPAPEL